MTFVPGPDWVTLTGHLMPPAAVPSWRTTSLPGWGPDDWAELSVLSAGADTAFGGNSGNEFSFSSCVLRSMNILTRF